MERVEGPRASAFRVTALTRQHDPMSVLTNASHGVSSVPSGTCLDMTFALALVA